MTSTLIYWILMADNIRTVFSVASTACLLVGLAALLAAGAIHDCGNDPRRVLRTSAALLVVGAITGTALAITPSTKQACVIYLAPKIINNEQVRKVPENVLKLLNAKMEEWIGEQVGDEPEPAEAGGGK